jgi:hypothetical protein
MGCIGDFLESRRGVLVVVYVSVSLAVCSITPSIQAYTRFESGLPQMLPPSPNSLFIFHPMLFRITSVSDSVCQM